jgi:hypothetical protein
VGPIPRRRRAAITGASLTALAAGPAVTWSVQQVGDGGDAWFDGPLADLAEP